VILKRLVNEVHLQIDDDMLARMDGTEPFGDYEVEFGRSVDLQALDDALLSFRGRDLSASDDAAMAIAVRRSLPLSAREAADRNLWWWVSARRYPTLVQSRWLVEQKGELHVTRERMLGQINRNAFARLWWGAEMVSGLEDLDAYTRLLFRNQDLFEAVIGRKLGRHPEALGVILQELAPLSGRVAREIVRDLRFLLSTLVLEAMSAEDLRNELRILKSGRSKD
jgi:hypothetical protein